MGRDLAQHRLRREAMPRKSAKTSVRSKSPKLPKPPKAYREFVERFPGLARAWQSINDAGADGPLDGRTRRLAKIAASMGAMREGAVRSGVRKALAEGISLAEIEQIVPLVAGTIGLPSAVACWNWLRDAAGRP
jgi:alkylhydroperoxidase/carboxymuconolactone decarboxylase family protein YurZ